MPKTKPNYLQIGELSKQSDLAVSALRYYEELGILIPHHKSDAKYRFYKPSAVSLVLFIKKSQHLGFSLDEIKEILKERNKGKSPCPKVRDIANKKIIELQQKIKDLKILEDELKKYITETRLGDDSSPEDFHVCKMINRVDIHK